MRRGAAWVVALALCVGGAAGCGGGDGDDTADGTTTTASTTTEPATSAIGDDLTAAVDDFCALSEEFERLARSAATAGGAGPAGPVDPSTSEAAEERLNELTGELTPLLVTLQSSTAQMVPGDATRFQECAAVFGGGAEVPE